MNPLAKQKVIGIDVSKDTLAVCFSLADKLQHLEVSNNKTGFQKLLKSGGSDCLYVMEAEPQMHGLRSAGSEFTTCSWLITSPNKALR
jgi:transposase